MRPRTVSRGESLAEFGIIDGMGKIFNIAGSCNPGRHYMLPATERVPDVMRLIEDEAYFVVHAQR